jgi:peptidoglycan/LPS O-acetylase OafA/YrhL
LVEGGPGAPEPVGKETGSGRAERAFRPDIEGLRAIAVGLVLLDHAGVAFLAGGYVGVDVFFVLSGFLITGLLLTEIEATGGLSLSRFYARRARRLLPAGSLVLIATVLASYRYLGGSRADRVAEDARWASLFAANFRFIQQGTDYFAAQLPPSPLQHFWSLAVEEQFYAVWPTLLILVAAVAKRVPIRTKLCVLLAVLLPASLLWSVHQTEANATAAYFSPLTRAWELGAGALLAVATPWLHPLSRRLGLATGVAGMAAIAAGGLLFDATTRFPGDAALLPVVGTVLAVAGGSIAPGEGAAWMLGKRAFRWVGRVSYSLYLWHWPVLVVAAGWAGHDLAVGQNLLLCLLALGLSAVTYRFVEAPVREAARLKRRPPKVSLAFGATLVALSFAVITWTGQWQAQAGDAASSATGVTIAPTTDAVIAAVADAASVGKWPPQPARIANPANSKQCNVSRKATAPPLCIDGDPNAERTVVIYGDSHGAMWIPALDVIGKQAHWKVVQLTKPACQVADFPSYSDVLGREYTECSTFRQYALGQIAAMKPDLVILTSAYKGVLRSRDGKRTTEGVDAAWETGLGAMIDRITPVAGRVIVLGDMAYPVQPGIDCLSAHAHDVKACDTPRSKAVYADHNAMEARVAAAHGARYVDAVPWFCTADVCPAVIGGLTVHRDAYHVAENYAVWLSTALGTATGLLPATATPVAPG